VGFPRTRPGTRDATLHVPTSSGAVDVPLQGFVYGGVTKFEMHSEQGDFIGQGANYSYSLSTAFLGANGTAQHVGFSSVIPNGGDWWYADLSPAPGGALARGTYAGAQRDGYAGSNPGLDVQGNGRGCNAINGTFTISDIGFYPDDGQLRRVGATFEQHCEGSAPALRGELAFRAGDTTPPAPWMPGGSAADPQAAPPAAAKAPVCLRTAGAHAHVIGGTSRPDRIRGTRRADAIEGRAGPDRIWGGPGADCIEGGAGRDRISAGPGRDRVYAGSGNDVINGGPGRDAIDCGRGRDVAHVGRGDRTRHCERIVRNG
jgi:Ca2+-binding RTX toxin-like protein